MKIANTKTDSSELISLEKIISEGISRVGDALKRIRDGMLYRETHTTFEEYCRDRWGRTRMWASRQIAAAVFAAEHPGVSQDQLRRIASGRPLLAEGADAAPAEAEGHDSHTYMEGWSASDRRCYADMESIARGRMDGLSESSDFRVREMSDEVKAKLLNELPAVLARCKSGEVRPGRAWPGLLGKISDQRGPADVNPGANLCKAMKSLRKWIDRWNEVSPADRREALEAYADILGKLPSDFRRVKPTISIS